MYNISKEKFLKAVENSISKCGVCRECSWYANGAGIRRVDKFVKLYNIDISHFNSNYRESTYKTITKICPVCQKPFTTKENHSREKTVCSHGCSNVHFRSGTNNGNYKNGHSGERGYRVTCFNHYDKKCAICDWDLVVDVHHIDGSHKNKDPKNLIPLCPNHHKLTLMKKHKEDINKQIKEIVDEKWK